MKKNQLYRKFLKLRKHAEKGQYVLNNVNLQGNIQMISSKHKCELPKSILQFKKRFRWQKSSVRISFLFLGIMPSPICVDDIFATVKFSFSLIRDQKFDVI